MKGIVLVLNFVFIIQSTLATTTVGDGNILTEQVETVYQYNHLRNVVAPQLPELDNAQVSILLEETKDLKERMEKYPTVFKEAEIIKMDEFISELDTSITVREGLSACELDEDADITKSEIAVFSDYGLLGENNGCRSLVKESYSFPELNTIKDVGVYMIQKQMAEEIHKAAMQEKIASYFDILSRHGSKGLGLEKIKKELCDDDLKDCGQENLTQISNLYSNLDPTINYKTLGEKEKINLQSKVNDGIEDLNKNLSLLKRKVKKNDSLFAIGGNDYLISCNEESEDAKLYREYQKSVENMLNPNTENKGKTGRIQSDLVVTMLYDHIGAPVVPESECNEDGFREITIDKVHHKFVTLENMNDASEKIVKNAAKAISMEVDDFDGGDDPVDYIGDQAHYAPHLVGSFLAKNPETTQLVCSGLEDFQSDKIRNERIETGIMALTALTAFTGLGGLGFMALRTALWAGAKAGGKEAIRTISKSGSFRFLKRNSNRLLTSKGAVLSYGAVTAGEVATLQTLRRNKKEDTEKLEQLILNMPDSKQKDALYDEYLKVSQLDFDFYLAAGAGVFDISAVLGMVKLNKALSESEAAELTAHLKEKRIQLEKLKNDPNYSPLKALKMLLPEDEYVSLIKNLNSELKPEDMDKFVANFRLNLDVSNGDFLLALQDTIKQSELKIDIPNGKELNRIVLDDIPEEDFPQFVLEMNSKYDDLFTKYKIDNNEQREDLASIIHILEKNEKFTSRNLPISEQRNIVEKKLDDILAKNGCK